MCILYNAARSLSRAGQLKSCKDLLKANGEEERDESVIGIQNTRDRGKVNEVRTTR